MSDKKKWLSKLQSLNGAVVERHNPFNHVLEFGIPAVDFTFGNTWGLPLGYSLCLFGPPKSGKTVLCNKMIGRLHQNDPDAIAIKFDTEFRSEGQLTEGTAKMYGVDWDRMQAVETNSPVDVFDQIEQNIGAWCQDGMPVKLVIIDSISQIQGLRGMAADTVDKHLIGDHALTVQNGLKRILPVQRKHKFAVIVTCQVRAEMDQTEVMRGNKYKMAASFGVQHYAEYFMLVERNRNKDGRTGLDGVEFKDESLGDSLGRAEQTGHKIRVTMKDSSVGPKGRVGEFVFDYKKGHVSVHEEVFLLAKNRGIFERPNQQMWVFGNKQYRGQPAVITALKEDDDLRNAVIQELRKRDLAGAFAAEDAQAEAELSHE